MQVVSVDALSRDTLHTIFSNVLGSMPAIAALNLRQSLGPLRPVVLPVATPLEVMSRCGMVFILAASGVRHQYIDASTIDELCVSAADHPSCRQPTNL